MYGSSSLRAVFAPSFLRISDNRQDGEHERGAVPSGATKGKGKGKGTREGNGKGADQNSNSTGANGGGSGSSSGDSGGGIRGSLGNARDRMRAVSSMEKFWRVYASVSHRELQFQSGGMRNKVRVSEPLPYGTTLQQLEGCFSHGDTSC